MWYDDDRIREIGLNNNELGLKDTVQEWQWFGCSKMQKHQKQRSFRLSQRNGQKTFVVVITAYTFLNVTFGLNICDITSQGITRCIYLHRDHKVLIHQLVGTSSNGWSVQRLKTRLMWLNERRQYLQGTSCSEQMIRHCSKSGRNSDGSREYTQDRWPVVLPWRHTGSVQRWSAGPLCRSLTPETPDPELFDHPVSYSITTASATRFNLLPQLPYG